jgi:hypothetical protein
LRVASHSGYVTPSAAGLASSSSMASLEVDASDDTACKPRFAEFVRCVGVSAPGGPPPLPVLRAEDSIFFNHLPMKPPPTGLVNTSGSSESSICASSSSVSCRARPRGTCRGFASSRSAARCSAAREDAASTLAARITPNSGAGSSTAARPSATLSDAAGESLRLARSRSPTDANLPGSRALLATSAR